MRILPLLILFAASAVSSAAAQKESKPPVIVKKVEPDYGGLTSRYAVDFTSVEIVIDSIGVPFSLEAKSGSLPDAVVQALAGWRYEPALKDGKAVGYALRLIVPVRRLIDGSLVSSCRRGWWPVSKELGEQLEAGAALDAAGAGKLEHDLKLTPDNVGARSSLLACYAGNCGSLEASERSKARVRHIAWLAANHPDAEILGRSLALINVDGGPFADVDGYRQVRQIWVDQVAKNSDKPAVLENAVNFLRIVDFEKAEALLVEARGRHPMNQIWLGDLYALAALGVTGFDLKTGFPASSKAYVEFNSKARAVLNTTTDAKVLLSGLATFAAGARALEAAGRPPADFSNVCGTLLERAKTLYPEIPEKCAASEPSAETSAPNNLKVDSVVMGAKLRKQPKPSYPDVPKARGMHGTVHFHAIIGKQGKVDRLELQSGPLAFYESSRDAVRRWEYQPMTLYGEPVEVVTTVEVNFRLSY